MCPHETGAGRIWLPLMPLNSWSIWRPFPDPRTRSELTAPIGPGCYELRRRSSGQLILHGAAAHTARRITSLLPHPYGIGSGDNSKRLKYVLDHIDDVEYRTVAFSSSREAQIFERDLPYKFSYIFRRIPKVRRLNSSQPERLEQVKSREASCFRNGSRGLR